MIRSPLFNDTLSLTNNVDRIAEQVFGGDPFRMLWSRASSAGANVPQPMPLDIYATDEHAVIFAAVPGMQPDDLQLTVQQNTVTLSGTIRDVTRSDEAKGATWYLHELGSGSYQRSVTLPFPVDADAAEATFEHGVLRVVLPKAESARPKKIAISNATERQAISAGTAS
jgi:HSP20 family protein